MSSGRSWPTAVWEHQLGVIPLLKDVFWIGLAVTVTAGLTFGTILTMILVPALYATFYGGEIKE